MSPTILTTNSDALASPPHSNQSLCFKILGPVREDFHNVQSLEKPLSDENPEEANMAVSHGTIKRLLTPMFIVLVIAGCGSGPTAPLPDHNRCFYQYTRYSPGCEPWTPVPDEMLTAHQPVHVSTPMAAPTTSTVVASIIPVTQTLPVTSTAEVRIVAAVSTGSPTLLESSALPALLRPTKIPASIVTVAKRGGDFTSIQAALDSIGDSGPHKHYLVQVGPGTYSETVTMKPYVDVEGAGELLTIITYGGSAEENTGTVVGANHAELRSLTVQNTGGNAYAIAIYNFHTSPHLTHVTASVSGGLTSVHGVYNSFSSPVMTDMVTSGSGGYWCNGVTNLNSSPIMTDLVASCSGGTDHYGVNNQYSSPKMMDVIASATGGSWSNGVFNLYGSPAMKNVIASASGGSIYDIGVNNSHSSPSMMGVTASASGGADNYGIGNNSSSPTIQNSAFTADGSSGNCYGMFNISGEELYTVTVSYSLIVGSTNAIHNDPAFSVHIETSQLSGGAIIGGGTMSCVDVLDENSIYYATTCPD